MCRLFWLPSAAFAQELVPLGEGEQAHRRRQCQWQQWQQSRPDGSIAPGLGCDIDGCAGAVGAAGAEQADAAATGGTWAAG